MIVVFDTDVLIPLILPSSKSSHLFQRIKNANDWCVAISPAILDEAAEKLRTKTSLRNWLGLPYTEIEKFINRLPSICVVTPGFVEIHGAVPGDPNDDIIIAAALESAADYIVSEDKHLRRLGHFQSIQIMNRDDFMSELDRLGIA